MVWVVDSCQNRFDVLASLRQLQPGMRNLGHIDCNTEEARYETVISYDTHTSVPSSANLLVPQAGISNIPHILYAVRSDYSKKKRKISRARSYPSVPTNQIHDQGEMYSWKEKARQDTSSEFRVDEPTSSVLPVNNHVLDAGTATCLGNMAKTRLACDRRTLVQM